MPKAKQAPRIAAAGSVAWVILAGCLTSGAQEVFAHGPAAAGAIAYESPAARLDGVLHDSAWHPPAPEPDGPHWMHRIAGLARGRTQFEGGYSLLSDTVGGVRGTQHAFPDFLLRFGLTERLELRFGWPGYVTGDIDLAPGGPSSRVLSPNVGFLYDLWSQRGLLPQTAVHAALPVPLEGNPFSLNSLQPLTELMYAWQTGERTTLTGRSGFALFRAEGHNYTQFQQSLAFDVALTERLGTFVSWNMLANHGSWNDTSQHMAGGGLSFLLTERLAVSWRAAGGLNSAAPDFITDIRFAYRF